MPRQSRARQRAGPRGGKTSWGDHLARGDPLTIVRGSVSAIDDANADTEPRAVASGDPTFLSPNLADRTGG